MRRGLIAVLVAGLAGCGTTVDSVPEPPPATTTATAPPEVTESVGVGPVEGDPCGAVSSAVRERLGVPEGGDRVEVGGAVGCRWEEGSTGTALGVIVETDQDPLGHPQPGAQRIEVGGFPGLRLGVRPESLCQVWVRTAPRQGFSVNYRSFDRPIDACGGALAVAEEVADRLR